MLLINSYIIANIINSNTKIFFNNEETIAENTEGKIKISHLQNNSNNKKAVIKINKITTDDIKKIVDENNKTSNVNTSQSLSLIFDSKKEEYYITNYTNTTHYTSPPKTPVEKEISTFSTLITNQKDSNRQGNISITCSVLNNTIVKSGETFSFCDVVGPSTVERGYKTANIIVQGTETKGIGGGNCQVSSTLYNAVLAVPNELEVIERHPHSARVPYIEAGKDAAISYRNS